MGELFNVMLGTVPRHSIYSQLFHTLDEMALGQNGLSQNGHVAAGTAVTSAGSTVEPTTESRTTPASVLKMWSSIKELHSKLRELGAPIYGTKDVLFRRLCEYEQIATKKKKFLESKKKDLAVATEPVRPKILPDQIQSSEVERQHNMVNHLPPAPWCDLCVMGRGKNYPHLRSDLREKGEQLPVIASDFPFVNTTSASAGTVL